MPKLSVLVPLLKENPYLKDCLDSILNASLFKDLELFVVASAVVEDQCKELLLQEFFQKDNRTQFLDFAHLSYAQACQEALKKVHGDYICFIAPSDQVIENFFSKLVECAEEKKMPMVVSSFYHYRDTLERVPQSLEAVKILPEDWQPKDNIYYLYGMTHSLLMKMNYSYATIYKTSLIRDNGIDLGEFSLNMAPFFQHCLICAEEFSFLKEELYYSRSEFYEQQVSFLDSFKAYLVNYELLHQDLARSRPRNYNLLKQNLYASQFSRAYEQVTGALCSNDLQLALTLLKESYAKAVREGFLKINLELKQRQFYNLLENGRLDARRIHCLNEAFKIKFYVTCLAKEVFLPIVIPFIFILRVFWLVSKALLLRRIS